LNPEPGFSPSSLDSFLNILRPLARSKLNDAKVGEPALHERIFADDRFDLLHILADRDDDSTVSWNLSTRDQEVAGGVVLLQEDDVGGHIRVDFSERDLVHELDDIHGRPSLQHRRVGVKKNNPETLVRLLEEPRLFYSVKEVPRGDLLGSLEHIVLLALVRLEDNAYGMTVRREIEERTGRSLSIGAVYATLDRLETKGYVSSSVGEPTAERGGRAKRLFRMEADGEAALRVSQEAIRKMTVGLRRRWGTT
jgi:PadR family transcriptional regulator